MRRSRASHWSVGVLAVEVGLFFVGRSAAGPVLGGGLAVAGLIAFLGVGFVFAVRDEMRHGTFPS